MNGMGEQELTEAWERILGGRDPILRLGRSVLGLLPSAPRCKLCHAPFSGPGAPLMRLIGKSPWKRNPRVCGVCINWLQKKGPGGAEIELSLLFADVRGSTGLAERMTPKAYGELINRFFRVASDAFIEQEAIIDQLVGDEAIGLFLPGYAGPEHTHRAIRAARRLLEATGHEGDGVPWIPIGVGVHRGLTFVGSVGSEGALTDFTALGDSVNTAARLASEARAGEILVSEAASTHASLDTAGLERRVLLLKGKSEPMSTVVIRTAAGRA